MIMLAHQLLLINKFYLFILGVSLLFFSCNEKNNKDKLSLKKEIEVSHSSSFKTVLLDSLYLEKNNGYMYHNDTLFTGEAIAYHQNKKMASRTNYRNGRRHGLREKWYDNGNNSLNTNYVNGLENGIKTTWWKNGKLLSKINLKEGKLDGVQLNWYKDGTLFKERNYVNGKAEGMQKSWRRNGKLYNNYEVKEGRVFGLKRSTLCYSLEDENVQVTSK